MDSENQVCINGEWVEAKPIEFHEGIIGKIISFIRKLLH